MLGVIVVLRRLRPAGPAAGLSRWLAAPPWAAAGNLRSPSLLLLVAHRSGRRALHLQTYETLPAHALIAQVHCERTGPRAYRVTLTRLPAGHMQVFEMAGDEWRLDVRTLAWTGAPRSWACSRRTGSSASSARSATIRAGPPAPIRDAAWPPPASP